MIWRVAWRMWAFVNYDLWPTMPVWFWWHRLGRRLWAMRERSYYKDFK